MADPLSIASGVAGLLTITHAISRTLTGYMRCVRDAPADVRSLVVELETLDELLTELNIVGFSTVDAPKVGDSRRGETLGNEDKHTARGPLSSTLRGRVTNCVRECTTVLQALQVKLKKFDFDKDGFVARLGKGVKWAHRKQDVEEVIRTLQKCKETLVLALHIESRSTGERIERYLKGLISETAQQSAGLSLIRRSGVENHLLLSQAIETKHDKVGMHSYGALRYKFAESEPGMEPYERARQLILLSDSQSPKQSFQIGLHVMEVCPNCSCEQTCVGCSTTDAGHGSRSYLPALLEKLPRTLAALWVSYGHADTFNRRRGILPNDSYRIDWYLSLLPKSPLGGTIYGRIDWNYKGLWSILPSLRVRPTVSINSEIFKACGRNDVAGVVELFRQGKATPFDRNGLGWTLLHAASGSLALDVLRLLLQEGADPNSYGVSVESFQSDNRSGLVEQTPLCSLFFRIPNTPREKATIHKAVNILLSHGADPSRIQIRRPPLPHKACLAYSLLGLRTLNDTTNALNPSLLPFNISETYILLQNNYCLSKITDPIAPNNGISALELAVAEGDFDSVIHLLKLFSEEKQHVLGEILTRTSSGEGFNLLHWCISGLMTLVDHWEFRHKCQRSRNLGYERIISPVTPLRDEHQSEENIPPPRNFPNLTTPPPTSPCYCSAAEITDHLTTRVSAIMNKATGYIRIISTLLKMTSESCAPSANNNSPREHPLLTTKTTTGNESPLSMARRFHITLEYRRLHKLYLPWGTYIPANLSPLLILHRGCSDAGIQLPRETWLPGDIFTKRNYDYDTAIAGSGRDEPTESTMDIKAFWPALYPTPSAGGDSASSPSPDIDPSSYIIPPEFAQVHSNIATLIKALTKFYSENCPPRSEPPHPQEDGEEPETEKEREMRLWNRYNLAKRHAPNIIDAIRRREKREVGDWEVWDGEGEGEALREEWGGLGAGLGKNIGKGKGRAGELDKGVTYMTPPPRMPLPPVPVPVHSNSFSASSSSRDSAALAPPPSYETAMNSRREVFPLTPASQSQSLPLPPLPPQPPSYYSLNTPIPPVDLSFNPEAIDLDEEDKDEELYFYDALEELL